MLFLDNSNFFNSIKFLQNDRCQDRIIDYYKLNKFVIRFLSNNLQYQNQTLFHVRTYYYDGEYTDILLNKIKKHLSSIPALPENQEEIARINSMLEKANKSMEAQKRQIEKMKNFYFFEARLKPLQYSKNQGIIQKGVDVQLAVDLVSNAYLNNYDIAVLFSGDIDLYESIKLIKSLGKQVIIFSSEKLTAQGMISISDLYMDICRLENSQLDEFTHIFERKNVLS